MAGSRGSSWHRRRVPLGNPWPLVVKKWNSANGRELFAPPWGTVVEKNGDAAFRAAWVRAAKIPIVAPYAAPMTWGEFRSAFDESGEELDLLLKSIVGVVRSVATKVLLVGFPVPHHVGDPICRIHWQPLSLDELSAEVKRAFATTRSRSGRGTARFRCAIQGSSHGSVDATGRPAEPRLVASYAPSFGAGRWS